MDNCVPKLEFGNEDERTRKRLLVMFEGFFDSASLRSE